MSRPDEDTDSIIRQVLEEEEAEALEGLDDATMAELLTATFRGRHRRLAIGGAVLNLLLFAAAIFTHRDVGRSSDGDDASDGAFLGRRPCLHCSVTAMAPLAPQVVLFGFDFLQAL